MMSNLPTLHAPYYTIEDTFTLLNRAGVQLLSAEEILLLAGKEKIEVSLLCDKSLTVIRKNDVDNQVASLAGEPIGNHGLCCDWLAINEIKLQPIERLGTGGTPNGFYMIDRRERLLVKLRQAPEASVEDMHATAWLEPSTKKTLSLPATLLVNGETYYVCDNANCDPFSSLIDNKELPDRYYTGVFERFVQKGNYVVTKEAIQVYWENALTAPKTKLLKQNSSKREFPKENSDMSRDITLWLKNSWEELGKPRGCDFLKLLSKYEDGDRIPTEGSPIILRVTSGQKQGIKYYKRDGKEGFLARSTLENKVSQWKNE